MALSKNERQKMTARREQKTGRLETRGEVSSPYGRHGQRRPTVYYMRWLHGRIHRVRTRLGHV
ncbi:hypothetical protein K505DRAFT_68391 [Melanomma pulvis-pyrius CBS 109.77]|uniref:Uncharacterized protein n=1 Tax=Melanomma pulvis-pyrius CBS 109.77 TaxID=1314802 RepID=A0A6A6X566_9PLEO|nr:hypothetical protein K505DRAFT_68391 [Melanomma pulvis-pyrius CBS 109.77]